ncbi:hypothetical protein [Methylomusa anaerophila]|nr:hypothetical protein [Methylomusa anaerophila]
MVQSTFLFRRYRFQRQECLILQKGIFDAGIGSDIPSMIAFIRT